MPRVLNFKNFCKMFGITNSIKSSTEFLKVELLRLLVLGEFYFPLTIHCLLECLLNF